MDLDSQKFDETTCDMCGKDFEYTYNDMKESDYPDIIEGQYTLVMSWLVECPYCNCQNRLWKY